MKQPFVYIILSLLFFSSCQEEKISIGTKDSDTFYVENQGASMRVLVEGNTVSKTFLLIVHGGPGSNSFIYNTDYISQHLEDNYAVVYWDQRNAGASQGNANGDDLTLSTMTTDLKKVIQVIKYRYGQNINLFLLGHSFGGLLTSSFLTKDDNQSMVKGWIFADGSHNYPLNDTLTRQMLLTVGEQEVASGRNVSKWNPIISYCQAHTGNFTFDESMQLESYASTAETYFPEVKQFDLWSLIKQNAIKENWPLSSIGLNYLYSSNADLNKVLAKTSFSNLLNRINIPTLVLVGKRDFVCPKELADDLYNRIGSLDKKESVSDISGHNMFIQDEAFFCTEISSFIELHK